MDNYQAMNFYYGLLNLRAGFFNANLCEILMLVTQSILDNNHQSETAYYLVEKDVQGRKHLNSDQVEFRSFYEDGHVLHNVKIDTQSDFFLDPTRADTVKWHVSFTVAKDVRPADQFIIQLSPNLIVAPNGHLQKPISDFVDQDGVVIAMGEYHANKHQLIYTFTNYVTEHRQIIGELEGELAIDPLTTPGNAFGLTCFISVDGYQKEFTIDVDYPDFDDGMFLGISSRMMQFDQDSHVFTDLIYVNLARKDLNHAYIVFNTSELVEELSNAIVKPSTMQIAIYQNSQGLKLPQSYGVDFQRLREVTNHFPVVKEDHLVETPFTMSFADNKMRLNFTANSTNDSYVIKVIGQYNDELNGSVRLRARLFGADQQNVYMSNSTTATAEEIPMKAIGSTASKSLINDLTSDIKIAEITTKFPNKSPEVEALKEQTIDIPITLGETSINPRRTESSEENKMAKDAKQIRDDLGSSTKAIGGAGESVVAQNVVGGDELSISFNVFRQANEDDKNEASTAPLPIPRRRVPRRKVHLQSNTNRLNRSLRHLRRF